MQSISIFLITTCALATVFLLQPIETARLQRKNQLSTNDEINNKLSQMRKKSSITTNVHLDTTIDEDAKYLSTMTFTFNCTNRPSGFYADIEHNCTVFHTCNENHERISYKCSNDSAFNQEYRICDWKYNFKCNNSEMWFFKNEILYQHTNRQTYFEDDDEYSPEYDIDIK